MNTAFNRRVRVVEYDADQLVEFFRRLLGELDKGNIDDARDTIRDVIAKIARTARDERP